MSSGVVKDILTNHNSKLINHPDPLSYLSPIVKVTLLVVTSLSVWQSAGSLESFFTQLTTPTDPTKASARILLMAMNLGISSCQ